MVNEWLRPIKRQRGTVAGVGNMLAGAMSPKPNLQPVWAASRAMRAVSSRGDRKGNCIHVGTLIANDAGLDELDRRMNNRKRLKKRDRRRANSPNAQDR